MKEKEASSEFGVKNFHKYKKDCDTIEGNEIFSWMTKKLLW
jgi:hypothetical protein